MPYLCHGLGFVIYCFFYFFCYVLMCLVMTFHFLSLSVFCLFSVYTWVLFVHSCVLITLVNLFVCIQSPAPVLQHLRVLCVHTLFSAFSGLSSVLYFSLVFPWAFLGLPCDACFLYSSLSFKLTFFFLLHTCLTRLYIWVDLYKPQHFYFFFMNNMFKTWTFHATKALLSTMKWRRGLLASTFLNVFFIEVKKHLLIGSRPLYR